MRELIEAHDIIVNRNTDIRLLKVRGTRQETVHAHWADWDGRLIEKKALDLLMELIEKLHPEYLQSAEEYFAGWEFRTSNCYILRRDLFSRLCDFQFPVLFELEKRLDMNGYKNNMKRTPSYIGEIMYGIFIHHLQKQKLYRIKELPLVFFEETRRAEFFVNSVARRCRNFLKIISFFVLPLNSKRRKVVRAYFHKISDLFKK